MLFVALGPVWEQLFYNIVASGRKGVGYGNLSAMGDTTRLVADC